MRFCWVSYLIVFMAHKARYRRMKNSYSRKKKTEVQTNKKIKFGADVIYMAKKYDERLIAYSRLLAQNAHK